MDNWEALKDFAKRGAELQRAIDEMGCGDPIKAKAESLQKSIEAALVVAEDAIYEGDHHRMWVIDQMVRILAGDNYEQWVLEREGEWDTGIAP
jgi:phosphatidylserine/phosphatidylglycerophosphate/cardiolipin synthase-like enzyme